MHHQVTGSSLESNRSDERLVLEITGLRKTFGKREVLKGLNIRLESGICLALLGPNGAGKTTTIRIILGLVVATGGEIRVFGKSIPRNLRKVKYQVGVVPQMDNLDPDLTVLENLLIYARYFRIKKAAARQRAAELLEFFALTNRRDEIIQNLSGGQRRRLLLARALMNRPRLLILDEPTIGLDPQARLLIWERLRHLRKHGTTMLLTSHYMEEVTRLATKVIIIDYGKSIARGSPTEMVERMLGTEIMEFSGPEEKLARLQKALEDCNVSTERLKNRLYVYIKQGCRELDSAAMDFPMVIKRPATLEDLFLKLTGRNLRET